MSTKRRVAAVGFGVVGLIVVASLSQVHGWLVAILPLAESVIRTRPWIGGTVFVLFSAAAAMLAFVSSAVIVPIGVYVWGKGVSMLLLLVGWVLGGVTSYGIGRYLGRPAVQALVSSPLLDRYTERFSQAAPFGLVLLFQAAMPSEVPGYLLGLVRYRFWKYMVALTLTEIPYSIATVYLGAGFVERQIAMIVGAGIAMAVFSGWALHLLRLRLAAQRR